MPIFDHQIEQQQNEVLRNWILIIQNIHFPCQGQHHSHQFMRLPTVEEQSSPAASIGTAGAASLTLGDIPSTIEVDEDGREGQRPTGLDDTRILYA